MSITQSPTLPEILPTGLPDFLKPFDLDGDGHLAQDEIRKIADLPSSSLVKIEEETAYLLVNEILAAAKIAKEKLVPTEDVTFDEFRILASLFSHDTANRHKTEEYAGMSQSTIASETNLSASTVSSLLDKMDAGRTKRDPSVRPWIDRTENPDNRREKLIALTEKGRAHFRLARRDYKRQLTKSLLTRLSFEQLLGMWENLFRFNVALHPEHLAPAESPEDD